VGRRKDELLDYLINSATEDLQKAEDYLWLYNFNEAFKVADSASSYINKKLLTKGLTINTLINESKQLKKKEMIPGSNIGHMLTLLAPIISRLSKIREDTKELTGIDWNVLSAVVKRFESCTVIRMYDVYVTRCILPRKPQLNKEKFEFMMRTELKPLDFEILGEDAELEGIIWLQNIVLEVAILYEKLEIRLRVSPSERENEEKVIQIISKLVELIKSFT